MKKRWWWTLSDEKVKKNSNFIWTQLKDKTYYSKENKEFATLEKNMEEF